MCVLLHKLTSRHRLLSCFWRPGYMNGSSVCPNILKSRHISGEGRLKAHEDKSRGLHMQGSWKSLSTLWTRKSLKTLKNQPLSGIHGEGRTQDKPWPWGDSKGNTGNPGFLEHRLSSRIYSFSSSPGTFSKRPHAGHKTHPNTFQRVEAIQQLLSDLYEIKLELNHSKKSWEIPKELEI